MNKKILYGLMFSLVLIPGLTLANDDLNQVEAPVPTLYSMPVESGEVVPTLINEVEADNAPELISAKPVLYSAPVSTALYQVNSPYEALKLMQETGLGIAQKDFERFSLDTPSKLDGKILLNVEDMGKAYIVDYENKKLIYLGKPDNAFRILKNYPDQPTEELSQALSGREWKWVKTVMNNDEITLPKNSDAFTIKFEDGNFAGTTDCNRYFGEYEKSNDDLILGPIGSTRMFCDGSQEFEFTKSLGEVDKYLFDDKERLVLTLKFDSGSMIFE